MKSTPALLLASALLMACTVEPPAEAAKQVEAEQASQASQTEAEAKAKSNELTPEELELLAADPKTLTPDQNRKRAYALRKKVMQNPDSEAAKTLNDMAAAVLAGEVEVQVGEGKKDEGLVIPAPPHLRSDEQAVSHDEPAEDQPQPEAPAEPAKPAGL